MFVTNCVFVSKTQSNNLCLAARFGAFVLFHLIFSFHVPIYRALTLFTPIEFVCTLPYNFQFHEYEEEEGEISTRF